MIRDRFGRWTLPKGRLDPGETAREAAIRETREETGLRIEIEETLGRTHYTLCRDGESLCKTVWYYLARTSEDELQPNIGEISDARWVTYETFLDHCDYGNNRKIYRRALEILAGGEHIDVTADKG